MGALVIRFSLILGTVGRSSQLERFLRSLEQQTHKAVQLIVVDQNQTDVLRERFERLPPWIEVLYLRSTPGLSKARNLALPHVSGDIVAFPDDDCWYAPGLLGEVAALFERSENVDGITGRSIDETSRTTSGDFAKVSGKLDKLGVWTRGSSYTIFLRESIWRRVGLFDEDLGVGSQRPFGAAEDTDYLVRALLAGASIDYHSNVCVFHPNNAWPIDESVYRRSFSYGAGMGRVLLKHDYPLFFKLRSLVRPFMGTVLAVLQQDRKTARLRWATLKGRIFGLRFGRNFVCSPAPQNTTGGDR